MRRLVVAAVAVVSVAGGAVVAFRRNPRRGTRLMNGIVNPFLVRRSLAGGGHSDVGTLEHVGRRSGARRLTPVHPVPVADGFRIVVPLGGESEWARNVMAAGHCRLQLHDTVYELDEPALLVPNTIQDLSPAVRSAAGWLGFRYLQMHRFSEQPGALEAPEATGASGIGVGAVDARTLEVSAAR